MDLTIGTFNLNNLFDRFNFEADLGTLPAAERDVRTTYSWQFVGQGTGPGVPPPQLDAPASSTPVFRIQKDANGSLLKPKPLASQQAIAGRIARINVDVLAVQEVENLDALRRFNREMLAAPCPYEVLIEGNDPRFIDVGVLSRLPVANLTSHRFEVHPADPTNPIFGRDLLEVDILNASRSRRLLKLFVNHLKSKLVPFNDPNPTATQAKNDLRRARQAETVARVVRSRTRADARYAVVGDMNDSRSAPTLAPMVEGLNLVDALADVVESQPPPPTTNPEDAPPAVRWTHRLSRANAPDVFELFDQIWVSPPLAARVTHAEIERRSKWHASSDGVGSDHDPVWIRLTGL